MLLASMKHVTFGYTDIPCLEDVNIEIEQGEFIGITGPNGAAKSTMLKLLLGLLKPWDGEIQICQNSEGKKLTIGYVPQQVTSFNRGFPSNVIELVRSGRYPKVRWFSRFRKEDEEVVEKALKQVGMWDFRHRKIGDLSGGQKQRICIARALALESDLLVLDEPTTGMDKESRVGFYELMSHLVSMHKKTVLMITHDVEEVLPHLNRIITLERRERNGWKCFTSTSCSAHFGPVV